MHPRSTALVPMSLAFVLAPIFQSTERVSVGSTGIQGGADSGVAALAADGRWIAFTSLADDLTPSDFNGFADVFVRDTASGATSIASVSSSGAPANAESLGPVLSGNGRFVAFRSAASNLVASDFNGVSDVFVRDMLQSTTVRASVAFDGTDPNAWSYYQQMSYDGRFICFLSEANNLVAGDSNATFDVFVRDMLLQSTELASVSSSGVQSGLFEFNVDPSISADGQRIVFASVAEGLVPGLANGAMDIFLRDRVLGTTELVSFAGTGMAANGSSELPAISADGRFVAFLSSATNLVPGDTNGVQDVFVRDLAQATTERVSVSSTGAQGSQLSYLYYSHNTISGDGRFVVFESYAPELVPGDANAWNDVFVRDRRLQHTTLASVTSSGKQMHLGATRGVISIDGSAVAFESSDGHLVAGDTNGTGDVFLRRLDSSCAPIEAYCAGKSGSLGCFVSIGANGQPQLSGQTAFQITATGMQNQTSGLMCLGLAPAESHFAGDLLCVSQIFQRSPAKSSGGDEFGESCSGSFSWHLDALDLAEAGLAGTYVHAQWIGRDPGFPLGEQASSSDALVFVTCP